ncbi:MAG: Uma2 family endonuclease [Thermoleophilaceae bacterium]
MSDAGGGDTLVRPMLGSEAELHRLSYEDVLRMVEAGVMADEDRVELVDGVLVDMTPPSAVHSAMVAWLTRHFTLDAGEREVRVQDLLLVEGGFRMPDLMVIEGGSRDRHPSTALLVVEVSVTTQRRDAGKLRHYALAGVGEYWIVDVPARAVRVHRRPGKGGYEQVAVYRDGNQVATPVGAPPVRVSELLGGAS